MDTLSLDGSLTMEANAPVVALLNSPLKRVRRILARGLLVPVLFAFAVGLNISSSPALAQTVVTTLDPSMAVLFPKGTATLLQGSPTAFQTILGQSVILAGPVNPTVASFPLTNVPLTVTGIRANISGSGMNWGATGLVDILISSPVLVPAGGSVTFTYEVTTSLLGLGSTTGTLTAVVTPPVNPPPAPPPPTGGQFVYKASATNSAQQNTTNQVIPLLAGDVLTIGTCGIPGAVFSGDTFLRLRNGAGVQVASNDDSCGALGSKFTYTAPLTDGYEIRAGCFSNASCGGTVVWTIVRK